MSRYTVIDPSQLGPMIVLETIDSEVIIADRMARLKELWTQYDPPFGAAYDTEALEFDPLKINQEASTYFEIMLRDRVNQAARAVTTAFSSSTDLDAIATRYPAGVPRLTNETDDRYRRRIWLSVNALGPHGTAEAYQFWALTALDGLLRDATALQIRPSLYDHPYILITCLANGPEPRPTTADLLEIRRYIQSESRQGLTDIVAVVAPKVKEVKYRIQLKLYPGPDGPTIKAAVLANLTALKEKLYWLGQDHSLTAIHGACNVSGVHSALILEPAEDLLTPEDWIVNVKGIEVEVTGRAS